MESTNGRLGGGGVTDEMDQVLTDLAEARGLDPAIVRRRAGVLMAALDRAAQEGRPLILRDVEPDEREPSHGEGEE